MRVIFDANFDEIKRISGKTFLDFKRNGHQTKPKRRIRERNYFLKAWTSARGARRGGGLSHPPLIFKNIRIVESLLLFWLNEIFELFSPGQFSADTHV